VAREGLLYQTAHLRPATGVAILTESEFDNGTDAAPCTVVQLGGRARLADVTPVMGVDWPGRPTRFPGGRVLVYVATPAIWPDPAEEDRDRPVSGWRPPVPPGARMMAAAVGHPMPVATARPEGSGLTQRRLRWAVPPGSVYLLQFGDGGPEAESAALMWATATHGRAYGRDANDRLLTAGFGVVLTGVWS
jgi:CRISPR-associated protein Cmr3